MSIRLIAVASTLMLLAAGCGNGASGSSNGSGGGLRLSIIEPAGGAQINTPFTVRVKASVPLGTQQSGLHHIHVWFDDHANQYQVVEADHVQIDSGRLPAGRHVIHASLRNANHSPAGAEAQETVTVTGGAPAPATSAAPPAGGGYGY